MVEISVVLGAAFGVLLFLFGFFFGEASPSSPSVDSPSADASFLVRFGAKAPYWESNFLTRLDGIPDASSHVLSSLKWFMIDKTNLV